MGCFYSAMDKRLPFMDKRPPFIFNHYSVWIAETGGSVARMTLIHNGCAHAPFFTTDKRLPVALG